MRGIIKSFLPGKGYGFIDGEDGKSYFFHIRSVRGDKNAVVEGLEVAFEEKATPKGYEAVNVSFEARTTAPAYDVPGEILIFKDGVRGDWEILEKSSWVICSSTSESGESPDAARQMMIDGAKAIGANAIIHVVYSKATGSSGNYNYTIHQFSGIPVVVGKKRYGGRFRAEELKVLEAAADRVGLEIQRKYQELRQAISSRRMQAVWTAVSMVGIAVFLPLAEKSFFLISIVLGWGALFAVFYAWIKRPPRRFGWWLVKNEG